MLIECNFVDGDGLENIGANFVEGSIIFIIDFLVVNGIILPRDVFKSYNFDSSVYWKHLQYIEALFLDNWQSKPSIIVGKLVTEILRAEFIKCSQ